LRRTTSETLARSRRRATMAVPPDGAPAVRAIVRHDIAEFTSRFNGQYATWFSESRSRHWHYLHHLDGSPRHCEMRAVGKKGGSCFVRFGLHDGVAADVVFDIGNTTLRCLFGLPAHPSLQNSPYSSSSTPPTPPYSSSCPPHLCSPSSSAFPPCPFCTTPRTFSCDFSFASY
jgi:hypothetical protein